MEFKAKEIQPPQNVLKWPDVTLVDAKIKRSRDARMERSQGKSAGEFN